MTTHHSPLTTPLLILVGPTGVGKTAVAVELCDLLNGEIVSADSMQIYRGCDIATAKPSTAELARAPHHLIDIREPTEKYSAADWAHDAQIAINDIVARHKQPLIVGGTGFYIRALLEPQTLAEVPPDPALRQRLEQEASTHGAQWLYDYLKSLDAAAAQRLHPNDIRRVIRAIEVGQGRKHATTGNTVIVNRQSSIVNHTVFGLDLPRPQLYARLEKRIDKMMGVGFMEELHTLMDQGVPLDSTVMQGLGYRQMLPALENPTLLPECIEIWKRDTRRYAKRQLTWFRHQLPVHWISITQEEAPTTIAQEIYGAWMSQQQNP